MKNGSKKIICLLLAVLCLCLTACGNDGGGIGSIGMDETEKKGDLAPLGGGAADNTPEPSDNTPKPSDNTPEPSQQPQSGLQTEAYENEYFKMTIPAGWTMDYEVYDAGSGLMRIVLAVSDPENSNNRIFFATALEPFFVSVNSKNSWLDYLPDYMQWAPVLDGTPSAEAVLKLWPDIFTILQSEGLGYDRFFGNYVVDEVVTTTDNGSTADATNTAVLATVKIQGANGKYGMYFTDSLSMSDLGSGLKFYTSYGNIGVAVEDAKYDEYFNTMLSCAASMDFSGFNKKYS